MSWVISVPPASRDIHERGIGGLVRGTQTLRGARGDAPKLAGLKEATSDWVGRYRPVANFTNDFLLDRDEQRSLTTYSGVPSDAQDPMTQESMGALYDRTQEHLATTDSMIIRTRRRLIDAARELQAGGAIPPGVDEPALYRLRSGGAILPAGANGLEVLRDVIRARAQTIELETVAG
jgi:hypothetical protein